MTQRGRRLAVGAALAACVWTAAACQQTGEEPPGGPDAATPAPADPAGATTADARDPGAGATTADDGRTVGAGETPGADEDQREVSDEEVHEALLAMDDALQDGDVEAYLERVGPTLRDEQRAWFQGVTSAPLAVRELRLDGVVSRTGSEGTVAHVGLRHQFADADPVPVLQQYRWVFTATGDGPAVLVDSRGRNGPFYGHPQLWDLGHELTLLEGHSVALLVQRDRAPEAETLLDTLDRAAEETLSELPWVGEDRDRLVVQLAPAEVLVEHEWPESTGSPLLLMASPEAIPREPGRLTGLQAPVHAHLFLDLDLALEDLEDYGASPGGQTELRYVAAYAATWGEDPDAWPEDWVLQGPAYWWSAVADPVYADNLLVAAGDHLALAGEPTALPRSPLDPDDLDAMDAYVLESLALAFHLDETYGRDALVDLVGRLIPLDQRYDAQEIEQAYLETLGTGREGLLQSFAGWAQTLPTSDDGAGPPPRGR